MKTSAYAALILGLALFIAIIVWEGAGDVAAALAVAGWGLVIVALYHFVPLSADALAWRSLFRRPQPAFAHLLRARWICDAVNSLLPVAQVGGDVARARVMMAHGVPGRLSGATVVVDITLSAVTQVLFALGGVVLLIYRLGRRDLAEYVVVGLLVFAVLLGIFYRLQRRGLFGTMARILARTTGGRIWLDMVGGADAIDASISDVYRAPRGILLGACFNLLSWMLGTGEVWLAMHFLGHSVTVLEAVMLESLGQAVRQAAFAIPASLGVQEGSYLFLGGLIGLSPDLSLALSLAKRAREVMLGVPGLLVWQSIERDQLRQRGAADEPPA